LFIEKVWVIIELNAMEIKKYYFSQILLFMLAVSLVSCNLEDFNLNKLAKPTDVIPDIFAPLAYGSFKIKDLVAAPEPNDNSQVPAGGITLEPILLNRSGTTFRSDAMDSVYLVIHFTNNTPVDIEFTINFSNGTAGSQIGKSFVSENIPPGAINQKIIFGLGPQDQDNLQIAKSFNLSFRITSPDATNPETYGVIKNTSFTTQLYFYAPINLGKL
jgi:hypothetical protein